MIPGSTWWTIWTVAETVGNATVGVFVFSGIWMYFKRHFKPGAGDVPPRVRKVFRVTKRLFWVAFVLEWAGAIVLRGPLDWWQALLLLNEVWTYYTLRDEDDDDFYKRMRKKATDVVKSLGHRLVVAPAGS